MGRAREGGLSSGLANALTGDLVALPSISLISVDVRGSTREVGAETEHVCKSLELNVPVHVQIRV